MYASAYSAEHDSELRYKVHWKYSKALWHIQNKVHKTEPDHERRISFEFLVLLKLCVRVGLIGFHLNIVQARKDEICKRTEEIKWNKRTFQGWGKITFSCSLLKILELNSSLDCHKILINHFFFNIGEGMFIVGYTSKTK